MTIIETTVENVLKGDRISFHRNSEPRKVLFVSLPEERKQPSLDSMVWVVYDEAGAPTVYKLPYTDVFVHFRDSADADH